MLFSYAKNTYKQDIEQKEKLKHKENNKFIQFALLLRYKG